MRSIAVSLLLIASACGGKNAGTASSSGSTAGGSNAGGSTGTSAGGSTGASAGGTTTGGASSGLGASSSGSDGGASAGASSGALACVDSDHDTYGDDCAAGPDCNDNDASHFDDCACTDADDDGYGAGCDLGDDCDDGDADHWSDCTTCVDNDGDHFFAGACDKPNGNGLDCNDGNAHFTSACPHLGLLEDINPGAGEVVAPDSSPASFVASGTHVYFTATDSRNGSELWITAGTPATTHIVRDIAPGPAGSSPAHLVDVAGKLFFTATQTVEGSAVTQLWVSDGTAAGTKVVDPALVASSYFIPSTMFAFASRLFFMVNPGSHTELWSTDGKTAAKVAGVPNLAGGDAIGSGMTVAGNALFVLAGSPHQLWKIDAQLQPSQVGTLVSATWGNPVTVSAQHVAGSTICFTVEYDYTDTVAEIRHELYCSNGSALELVAEAVVPASASPPVSTTYYEIDALLTTPTTLYFVYGSYDYTVLGGPVHDRHYKVYKKVIGEGGSGAVIYASGTGAADYDVVDSLAIVGSDVFLVNVSGAGAAATSLIEVSGTTATTVMPAGNVEVSQLTPVGGSLYFTVQTGSKKLWKAKGTAAAVAVTYPQPQSTCNATAVDSLTALDGVLYFMANVSGVGTELCTKGESGTPLLVHSFVSGSVSPWVPMFVTQAGRGAGSNPYIYLGADDGAIGVEPYRYDPAGNGDGVVLLANIADAQDTSVFGGAIDASSISSGIAAFVATNGKDNFELWRSDGTTANTSMVKEINPGTSPAKGSHPNALALINSKLYFAADDGTTGSELWRSDLTSAGTTMVANIFVDGANPNSSSPYGMTLYNGAIVFAAASTHAANVELWTYTEGGSVPAQVADINPGSTVGSSPSGFALFDGDLFFAANNGTDGAELWRTDDTGAGTVEDYNIYNGASGSAPTAFTVSLDSNDMFFVATSAASGTELWRRHVGANTLACLTNALNASQATSSNPSGLVRVAATDIYFFSATGADGTELYRLVWDGTTAAVDEVADIRSGVSGSNPSNIVQVGSRMVFIADDGVHGAELWSVDATSSSSNAALVADIYPGAVSSAPSDLFAVPGTTRALFAASDGVNGVELWATDGTAANTFLVADVIAGPGSSNPQGFSYVGGPAPRVYFTVDDGVVGREPWSMLVSDFTLGGCSA